jgi:16S rRNA (guanine966-N2)-methyltransferase
LVGHADLLTHNAAMRIIAGSRKGHRIVAPKGERTRPTGDRTREAIFNLTGPVDGAAVLDLYAGSGALGLEALSRGAQTVVFVESDRAACRAIKDNLERLRLTGATVANRDVAAVLREEATRGRTYDLVLADPPYAEFEQHAQRLADLVPQVLAADGLFVIETGERVEPRFPLDPVTSRRYGSARITIFTHHR